jgi:hypothetical protein
MGKYGYNLAVLNSDCKNSKILYFPQFKGNLFTPVPAGLLSLPAGWQGFIIKFYFLR